MIIINDVVKLHSCKSFFFSDQEIRNNYIDDDISLYHHDDISSRASQGYNIRLAR